MSADQLGPWIERANKAKDEANKILGAAGSTSSRVYFLEDVQAKLSGTPVDVQDYFTEAIVCLKNELNRSAIVVSWAGYFSIFCESLFSAKQAEIQTKRPKWLFTNSTELKEAAPEAQIIDAAKEVGFIKNAKLRMLDGWLSQRNQCAHPTVYSPSANVSIGFVDSMVDEVLVLIGDSRP